VREFLFLFSVMFLQYFLATLNIRACAQANYLFTALSDMAIAFNSYFLIKRVADSKSKLGLAGYIIGGAIGSQLGIYVTKLLYHQ
jgi:hypothetical protein